MSPFVIRKRPRLKHFALDFFFFFFAIVAINLFKNRIRFDKLGPGVMCFIPQHGLQNKKNPSPLSSRGGKESEIEEKQSLM